MITMEFDEMKKIWDAQNNEPIYGINEKALQNRILANKNQAFHITNTSELLLTFVYFGVGCYFLYVNIFKPSGNIFMYLLMAWMFFSAFYVLFSRIQRLRKNQVFDRSVRNDLQHAVSVATYQVRLSQISRWNILPMGTLILLATWKGGESIWFLAGLVLFFAITHYAARWEHNLYKSRKRDLETLQHKLENEFS